MHNHKLDKNHRYCIICGMKVIGSSFRGATPEEKKEWEKKTTKFIADTLDQLEETTYEKSMKLGKEVREKLRYKELIQNEEKKKSIFGASYELEKCPLCGQRVLDVVCPPNEDKKSIVKCKNFEERFAELVRISDEANEIMKNKEKKEKQLPMTFNGETFFVDETIYDLVRLLNERYRTTIASCSGHGFQPASIVFNDNTEMRIMTFEQARQVDKLFPDINGNTISTQSNEKVDGWKDRFEEEWKLLNDWTGSGFRYKKPELTVKGLKIMKKRFEQFIESLLSQKDKEWKDKIRLSINNWISLDKKGNEYLSNEDIINLKKELLK